MKGAVETPRPYSEPPRVGSPVRGNAIWLADLGRNHEKTCPTRTIVLNQAANPELSSNAVSRFSPKKEEFSRWQRSLVEVTSFSSASSKKLLF